MSDAEGTAYPWLAERMEMTNGDEASNATEPSNGHEPSSTDGAEPLVVSDSTPMNESGNGPAVPFLQSLVDAMRKIADQTREEALAKLRAAVAERSAEIRSETEQRAAELHEVANTDLAGDRRLGAGRDPAHSRRGVHQGLRAQCDARRTARSQHGGRRWRHDRGRGSGRRLRGTSGSWAFYAQLGDISDPAAFAAAAKRMPRPPRYEARPAPAGARHRPRPPAGPEITTAVETAVPRAGRRQNRRVTPPRRRGPSG